MAEQGVPDNLPPLNETGITSAPNPAPAEPIPPVAPPRRTWRQWVADRIVNAALICALWGVAAFLLSIYGMEFANAVGFGFIGAFFGAFLVRPAVNGFLHKATPDLLATPQAPPPASPVESAREIVETVVFVVVLVLLLKSFVAEAFVIPTGSMAQTLYGYQKIVTCPSCSHRFPVNCSSEVEEREGRGRGGRIDRCTCPNCRQKIHLVLPGSQRQGDLGVDFATVVDPGWRSGDRVLVSKDSYDLPGVGPNRLDVVVFKFPGNNGDLNQPDLFPDSGPFSKNGVAMNYIKRLIGLPGETVAIHRGKVFILPPEKSHRYARDEEMLKDPWLRLQMWQREHTHPNDPRARQQFNDGEFAIVRKRPAVLLDMMRLVYDNDLPARDLGDEGYQRWVPARDSGWATDGARGFRHGGATDQMTWLRYRHVLRGTPGKPQLITDFTAYNTWGSRERGGDSTGKNWASDLIAECEVVAEKAEGRFAVELSRANSRYQAVFEPATGDCTLLRLKDGKPVEELGKAPCKFKGTGTFRVRFANSDDRLLVWVNDSLAFGDGVPYKEELTLVPIAANDLEKPVSLGAQGGRFGAKHLKVFRDTYYTAREHPSAPDVNFSPESPDGREMSGAWSVFADSPLATFYVQPGHYLCLGDNSPESADSRSWGLVPQRLMLGRAVVVYFPFTRMGRIR